MQARAACRSWYGASAYDGESRLVEEDALSTHRLRVGGRLEWGTKDLRRFHCGTRRLPHVWPHTLTLRVHALCPALYPCPLSSPAALAV